MKTRTENKCPICGGTFLARHNDKIICLSKGKEGLFCAGIIPARREEDKLLPVYQEGEWC